MSDMPRDPLADDRLSAWLDGELDAGEARHLEHELAVDSALAEALDELSAVRATIRAAGPVEPRPGALDRILAEVAAADTAPDRSPRPHVAPVVELHRRRVPTLAAVAAAVVIIAAVVGGVGGTTTLPAVGDLVARHDAAASDRTPADAEPMPMDDMDEMGAMPAMPAYMEMTDAFRDDGLLHVVYDDGAGGAVSVFRQEGDTDLEALGDGKVDDMGGTEVWSAAVGDRHVAVVDGRGYVWTVVGADDHDTMMVAMMDDLPEREPNLLDRLGDAADAVVRPWRVD